MGTKQEAYNEFTSLRAKAQEAKNLASDSTGVVHTEVKSSCCYLDILGDLHSYNKEWIKQRIRENSRIPNCYMIFGGDNSTNGNIVGAKHGDVYSSMLNPEDEMREFLDIVREIQEEEGVDLSGMTIGFIDGNHELRLYKAVSIRPGYWDSGAAGMGDVYYQNGIKEEIVLLDPTQDNMTKVVTALVRHGTGNPMNNGGNVDQATRRAPIHGTELVITQHSHGINMGNTLSHYPNNFEKLTVAVNLGTMQYGATYADESGYSLPGRINGEILRITLIPNANKTDSDTCIDLVNRQDILTETFNTLFNKAKDILSNVENAGYTTVKQYNAAYAEAEVKIGQLFSRMPTKKNKQDEVALNFIAGLRYGDEGIDNEKEINEMKVVEKLPNYVTILNGDLVYYGDHITKEQRSHEDFPEKFYSNLQLVAETLKNQRDHIIAYNYGPEEMKWFNNYSYEIAKMAMKTLQLPENLAYKPYSKRKLEATQATIQRKKVGLYNGNILYAECHDIVSSHPEVLKQFEESLKTKFSTENIIKIMFKVKEYFYSSVKDNQAYYCEDKTIADQQNPEDLFKTWVAERLNRGKCVRQGRKADQRRLISTRNKDAVNRIAPPEEVELRQPNPNLIGNMLFYMMGMTPEQIKKIAINPTYNTQTSNVIPMRTENGQFYSLYIIGQNSGSTAQRSAQESSFIRTQSNHLGYDIYYTTSKLGSEFITKPQAFMPTWKAKPKLKMFITFQHQDMMDKENILITVFQKTDYTLSAW
ncbi:MAG: hypothetical protein MJ152_00700 [Clostridia bacterium]|nr:hypothetical protein [Clostridia bacterium]